MDLTALIFAALKKANTANERIDNLPEPMVFKGTLGTGGTIESLPTASTSNKGFVYIVITDGTYAGVSAKAGDMFISDGSSWVLVPSSDEPSVIDDGVISTALTWSSKKISDEFGKIVKTFTYTGTGESSNHRIDLPVDCKAILAIVPSAETEIQSYNFVILNSVVPVLPQGSLLMGDILAANTTTAQNLHTVMHINFENGYILTENKNNTSIYNLNKQDVEYTVYYI